jgi:hypothetical protein
VPPAQIFISLLLLAGVVAGVYVTGSAPVLEEPTKLNGDGVTSVDGETPADPEALARGAGVDRNRYALARMVNSEFARYHEARVGSAWCCRNEATARGVSVFALLTLQVLKDSDGTHYHGPGDGFFGSQHGRYASTAQDSSDDSLAIADGVMSGAIPDNTGGARQFDSPQAFGIQIGTLASDVDDVAARRIAAGNELVTLEGVPESYARFWRPV